MNLNHANRTIFLVILCLSFLFFHSAQAQTKIIPDNPAQVMLSFAPLVKRVAPAVVNIFTRKRVQQRSLAFFQDPFFQQFFGGELPQGPARERIESSLGSGVIVKSLGFVVTSNHVVAGAEEIKVVLADRREFDAEVISSDEKADLAVLKIKTKGEELPYLKIKDSDDIEVGDIVLAIGNPFGVGQTVTSGIVSALARTNLDITDINYFIQTDAAINPGNSGGALVTMDGQLVGINSAIFSRSGGSMGIGFAVPSNMVRSIVEGALRGQKRLVRPWTGIKGQTVTSDVATSLGMARPMGVIVKGLHMASPARAEEVKVGDVITHVAGWEIEDEAAFSYRLATLPLGGEVELTLLRAGKEIKKQIKLIPPPEIPPRDEVLIDGHNPLRGARLANLSPALAEDYGLKDKDEGVVVVFVERGSQAARLGLEKGDIIIEINEQDIGSVKKARRELSKETRTWRLQLKRDNEVMNLMVGG